MEAFSLIFFLLGSTTLQLTREPSSARSDGAFTLCLGICRMEAVDAVSTVVQMRLGGK